MSRQIIFHIGQGKTGTTSIQAAMHQARDRLRENGICYPLSHIIPRNHHSLAVDFGGPESVNQNFREKMGPAPNVIRAKSEEEWQALYDRIARENPHKVLLSSESLFKPLTQQAHERMQVRIKAVEAEDVRILAYVRSPVSFYLSALQQRLKRGQILQMNAKAYLPVLDSYKDKFGSAFEIRKFEPDQLREQSVVTDFCEWTEIDLSLVKSGEEIYENVSLSAEAMSVLSRLFVSGETSVKNPHTRSLAVLNTVDQALAGFRKPRLKPKYVRQIIKTSQELIPLRAEHDLVFKDVDYDLAGQTPDRSPDMVMSIKQICRLDAERCRQLEDIFLEEIRKTRWGRSIAIHPLET